MTQRPVLIDHRCEDCNQTFVWVCITDDGIADLLCAGCGRQWQVAVAGDAALHKLADEPQFELRPIGETSVWNRPFYCPSCQSPDVKMFVWLESETLCVCQRCGNEFSVRYRR
jgi:transcription elongation factor Elf1